MNFIERHKLGKKPQGGFTSMSQPCKEFWIRMYNELKKDKERINNLFNVVEKYNSYQNLMPNW